MTTVEIAGACPHDCPDTCAMITTVVDGRATAIRGDADHPVTQGFLCAKVNRYQERTYHPDRILTPLRRIGPKGAGEFEPVSWATALAGISAGLRRVIDRDGPQAVLPYSYGGTLGLLQGNSMSARFFHRMGASLLDRTICASAGTAGWRSVYGNLSGPGPDDIDGVQFVVLWGTNTLTSNSHLWPAIRRAREAGARVVCVDPLKTRTAQASDEHVAIAPGTDGALALGMMRVIIDEGLVDEEFLTVHATGWDELRSAVLSEWSVERAAAITDVPASVIADLARQYATTRPSLIRLNYGMQRHAGGASAVRAVSLLPAITGAWRDSNGGALLSTSAASRFDSGAFARSEWIVSGTRTINMTRLGEALTNADAGVGGPPVSAMVVYNSNPAVIAPDTSVVRRGLAREDLLTVVLEQFPTDTTRYADWVLPATTQLEHWDLHTAYGHRFITLNSPAIESMGEAVSNTEAFRRLSAAMGYEENDLRVGDRDLVDEAIELIGAGSINREQLFQTGWMRIPTEDFSEQFARGLSTPSGRIECVGMNEGLDRVPDYRPPVEAASTTESGQLMLLSPPAHSLLNSTFANLERQGRAAGEQEVWVHPRDAAARSIATGDRVRIFNFRGEFTAIAEVTDRTRPGTAAAFGLRWMGSGESTSLNDVTSQELTDAGRGATFYDTAVEIDVLRPHEAASGE